MSEIHKPQKYVLSAQCFCENFLQGYISSMKTLHRFLGNFRPTGETGYYYNKVQLFLHELFPLILTTATKQKLHCLGYETLDHPPYAPDFWPTCCHFSNNSTASFVGNSLRIDVMQNSHSTNLLLLDIRSSTLLE